MNINTDKHIKNLIELLKIPSISAQKEHDKDTLKAAEWISDKLKKLNFEVDILPTEGHPIVYAQNLDAGEDRPTVLVYGHYDVQSPDPLDEWDSDPFEPEIRSNNIYGRGTADDKGQLYTWIAAIEEIGKLPLNMKFLIEGEEEIGSRNFKEFLKENKSLAKADICVISDSHSLSENEPLVCYGLRGLSYAQIAVETLNKDAHSGLYGGNVLNPAIELSKIIAKLKDDNGKILIDGFYDDVRVLTKKERDELSNFPFTEKEVKEETGAKIVVGEEGFNVAERAGARPTIDINGIWGGYVEEGQKTIIPARASAKLSMRLVPYQDPHDIFDKFKKYIEKISPEGAEVTVTKMSISYPIIMDRANKYFKSAEGALEKVFGNKPKYELSGGSIGAAAALKLDAGVDSILMGYGLPDDGLHSPNEKLSIAMFEKGIKTNIEFLKNLK